MFGTRFSVGHENIHFYESDCFVICRNSNFQKLEIITNDKLSDATLRPFTRNAGAVDLRQKLQLWSKCDFGWFGTRSQQIWCDLGSRP